MAETQHLFCAAIDFGTTYTGLAFEDWATKKKVVYTWNTDGLLEAEHKAPTAVLFKSDRTFVAFGFEAVKKYSRYNDNQKWDCYYFERFKMELHQEEKFTDEKKLPSTNNPEERVLPAIKVIAACMKFLKEKLLEILFASHKATESDIRWVVTVPAIWQASARQLMRRAAYEAGLCDKTKPHDLVISLEPESAALFVHEDLNLKAQRSNLENLEQTLDAFTITDASKLQSLKYQKYLILDCGGGTVDVCVHQVLNDENGFTVRECYRATGGAWGGIYVDKNFVQYLEKIFTKKFIEYAQKNLLTAWVEMMRDFECWKRQVLPLSDDQTEKMLDDEEDITPIGLSYRFISECEKYHKTTITKVLEKSHTTGAEIDTGMGKLIIQGSQMRKMLMSQIQKIVDHVKILKEKKECYKLDAIFLVGGFAECKLLQKAIIQAYQSKQCDIVVPINPSLAIVKGSIIFGFNPTVISQRVSAYTYGLRTMKLFKQGDNPKYKYVNSEGEVYCENLFKTIIKEMEQITKHNCQHKTTYTPVDRDQDAITITLYKAKKSEVKYVTEEGVERIGYMHVPLPGQGLDRKVEVIIDFSGTEIFASSRNLETNETKTISVDFLSKQC